MWVSTQLASEGITKLSSESASGGVGVSENLSHRGSSGDSAVVQRELPRKRCEAVPAVILGEKR